jgi:sugar phosphate isomerase/epimerase
MTMQRRDFLKWAGTAAAAGTNALGARGLAMHVPPLQKTLGVQLYTIRDLARADLPGVLKAIRAIGYTEVETYWDIYNRPAKELRALIEDHGLTAPSGHFDYDGLEAKIDYAKTLGVQFMICPMLPEKMWTSLDGYKAAADRMNAWGEKVRSAGMQLGFHNHNYEFKTFGATTGFATLMQLTDPSLVCLEMDCYWITQAGADPVAMMQNYGGRIKMLHLKDRAAGFAPSQVKDGAAEHFTEVGAGTIDWKSVLAAAERIGVQHYFVERDNGTVPPLESLAISYKYLRAAG